MKAGRAGWGRAEGSHVDDSLAFFCLLLWITPGNLLSLEGQLLAVWQWLSSPFGLGHKAKLGLFRPFPWGLYWPPNCGVLGGVHCWMEDNSGERPRNSTGENWTLTPKGIGGASEISTREGNQ